MRARLIAVTIVTLAVAAPLTAHAQRSGRSTDGDFGGRPSFGEEMGRKFDSMGDLKQVLDKITLTSEQRDSVIKIETTYRGVFRVSARNARDLFSRGRPSMDDLDKLRDDAEIQRDAEWAAVGRVLTEAQLPALQKNMENIKADDARRDADMRARMPRGGRP